MSSCFCWCWWLLWLETWRQWQGTKQAEVLLLTMLLLLWLRTCEGQSKRKWWEDARSSSNDGFPQHLSLLPQSDSAQINQTRTSITFRKFSPSSVVLKKGINLLKKNYIKKIPRLSPWLGLKRGLGEAGPSSKANPAGNIGAALGGSASWSRYTGTYTLPNLNL